MEIIGGIIFALIFIGLFASDGGFEDIKALRYNRAINNDIPLPAGAKFKYVKWNDSIHLLIDVNHGTGKDKDWRDTLRYSLNSIEVEDPETFNTDLKLLLHLAHWMREQYINTDEFTNTTSFPLEEGEWELDYRPNGDTVTVNGIVVARAEFNDYRDAVVAMVQSSPQIMARHSQELDAARQKRSIERVMSHVNPMTTREKV